MENQFHMEMNIVTIRRATDQAVQAVAELAYLAIEGIGYQLTG